ncbi:MAG TPA: methylenetetrahydrofolate reductase [Xanthobacteraceae bacterium]|jgi:methylenetetrahydrofolate reductase (NADPH)|nr:methylenetetrahydrofolate reductase [Xanthobacteraceae bacterium]
MNEQSGKSPLPSTLQERLRQRRFVMTAELVPPLSSDAQELWRKAAGLKGIADAVNVTDGAGARAHMSALAAATLLRQAGIEPILQITCRDKNRLALQSEMMGAAALGIRNLLLLSGDDPKTGDQPDTKPVFDVDSKTLIETARRLRDEGTLPTGRKVAGHADFFIGAADMPIDPPEGWQPNALIAKVQAGAQFAQTQFCMDAAIARRYVGALEKAGVTGKLALLIGVNPLRSAKSARWMKNHLYGTIIPDSFIARLEKAADPAREGLRICVELIEELSTIRGVAGVHIMAPGNDAAIPEAIAAARARVQRAAP